MMRSTLLPLPLTALMVLGMVVASWLLPTAPITRKLDWSVDTTDMLQHHEEEHNGQQGRWRHRTQMRQTREAK